MARPTNADAAATQRRILSSALALFAQRGARGASVRAIAADAGVSVAMIHHYFGNKDGLYDACIDAMYEELSALQQPLLVAIASGVDVPSAIARAVRSGYAFARQHSPEVRLLQREILTHGALPVTRQQAVQGPFLDQVGLLLATVLGKSPLEARLALQSVVMLVSRYALSSDEELALFTEGAPDPHRVVADHLVGVAAKILGIPDPPGISTDGYRTF